MAIDTAEKRRAALTSRVWLSGLGVTPNVSKDSEWRCQVSHFYSGITFSEATEGFPRELRRRRRQRGLARGRG